MISDAGNLSTRKQLCHDEPGKLHHVGVCPPDHQNNKAGPEVNLRPQVYWFPGETQHHIFDDVGILQNHERQS